MTSISTEQKEPTVKRVAIITVVLAVLLAGAALGASAYVQDPQASPLENHLLAVDDLDGYAPDGPAIVTREARAVGQLDPVLSDARLLRRLGFRAAAVRHLRAYGREDLRAVSRVLEFDTAWSARAYVAAVVNDLASTTKTFCLVSVPGATAFDSGADRGAGHGILFADGRYVHLVGVSAASRAVDDPAKDDLSRAARRLQARLHGIPPS
jgi:hypothetical protein